MYSGRFEKAKKISRLVDLLFCIDVYVYDMSDVSWLVCHLCYPFSAQSVHQ